MAESYLVLSDVHLGSDLNDSGPVVPRSKAIDADLAAMLAHYRRSTPAGERWHLVLAGDFIDFVGMSIDPPKGKTLTTTLTAHERKYGLMGAEEHVRLKCQRVAARHPEVFRELAGFVTDGNSVTFVSGNHDTEMHWPAVQDDLRAMLAGDDEMARARVAFEPWLLFRRGLFFVEHGHQYDPFCAYPYIMAPVSPADPQRIPPSLSDTLLRYVVRRTPGMREYGHEDRGLYSYISWGLKLGARGTFGLFYRFYEAISDLVQTAKAHGREGGARLRAEHTLRLAALAKRLDVDSRDLDRALALHSRPLSVSPRLVYASVMLDRLGAFFLLLAGLAALVGFWRQLGPVGGSAAAVTIVSVWLLAHVILSRGRPSVDPAATMLSSAQELTRLFPCAFVVMGHTHVPLSARIGNSVYLNTGSWAEEEPDPALDIAKAYRAARTHLVIHERDDGRHEAQLCAWKSGRGPETMETHVAATQRS